MDQRLKASRPQSVAEIESDIRAFWSQRGSDSTETRSIRNAFWLCQHTTGYLEEMYAHTLDCSRCQKRLGAS